MAPECGTRADGAPRQTLEDIRREIDAEYAAVGPAPDPDDPGPAPSITSRLSASAYGAGDEIAIERHYRARWRERRVLGYVAAAAIGGVAGQGLLIAYVVLAHGAGSGATPPVAARAAAAPAPAPSAAISPAPITDEGPSLDLPPRRVIPARRPSAPPRAAVVEAGDWATSQADLHRP